MGLNFGDLDNDGWLDFYLGTGNPDFDTLMPEPHVPQRRRQAASRTSPRPADFGHLQKGHGIAFADIDNDGDQDVFEKMGGAYQARSRLQRAVREPARGRRDAEGRLDRPRARKARPRTAPRSARG